MKNGNDDIIVNLSDMKGILVWFDAVVFSPSFKFCTWKGWFLWEASDLALDLYLHTQFKYRIYKEIQ